MALGLTASLLTALAGAVTPSAPSGEALARRVDARQKGVRDLTARFVQSYRSGVLGPRGRRARDARNQEARTDALGVQASPRSKLFVSDGKQFYFYVPADRQVIVQGPGGRAGHPDLPAGGAGHPGAVPGVRGAAAARDASGLRLVAAPGRPGGAAVFLDVDAEARVRAIEVWDVQGGHSRFQFEDVKENVGLPDAPFQFEVPRGRRGRDRMRSARTLAVLLALAVAGCASTNAFRAGEKAERRHEYDRAVLEYWHAVKLSPDKPEYRYALERARLRAAEAHAMAARRLSARGLHKQALGRDAPGAGPGAGLDVVLPPSMRTSRGTADGPAARRPRCSRSRSAPASAPCRAWRWAPRRASRSALSFRNASLREAYLALGKVAGVNFVFDPQFQDQTISARPERRAPSSRRCPRSPAPAGPSTASPTRASSRWYPTRPPSAASTSSRS